jgi:hypothetical protein
VARLVLELPRRAVKTPVKVLIVAALVVGLPLLFWTGTFLYWHVRIRSAIRSIDSMTPVDRAKAADAIKTIRSAGCRSLPYLVSAIRAERPDVGELLIFQIARQTSIPSTLIIEHRIQESQDLEERRQKCDRLRDWWKEKGPDYHQWWRVWSSKCAGDR